MSNIFGGDLTDEERNHINAIDEGEELEELEEELGTAGEESEEVEEPEESEEEAPVEPTPEPVVIPEEPKPDAAAFARLRWEAKQAKEELERVKAAAHPKVEQQEQTFDQVLMTMQDKIDKLTNHITYTTTEQAARQEFAQYEQAAQAKLPDYDQAANYMSKELHTAFSRTNPGANAQQISKMCDDYVLKRAAYALDQGIQPAEYLHHVAYKEFGFRPAQAETKVETPDRKPDLSKLAQNRKKSAGMAGANGKSQSDNLTAEAALDLSTAEFSRLSPQKIDELLASIQ